MHSLLEAVEFRDPARARGAALRLGAGLPERIAARIQVLLAAIPDPNTALRFLERLRMEAPSAFDRITSSTGALRCPIHLFSFSNFLSEAALKHPEHILHVAIPGVSTGILKITLGSYYAVLDPAR